MNYLFLLFGAVLKNNWQRDTWHHPALTSRKVATNDLVRKRICSSGQCGAVLQQSRVQKMKKKVTNPL